MIFSSTYFFLINHGGLFERDVTIFIRDEKKERIQNLTFFDLVYGRKKKKEIKNVSDIKLCFISFCL